MEFHTGSGEYKRCGVDPAVKFPIGFSAGKWLGVQDSNYRQIEKLKNEMISEEILWAGYTHRP